MSPIKTKIMHEAAKLFTTKGYLATSVQDIINQCHISKGSFYNYFKSKEELAFHLFKQKKEQLWEMIQRFEDDEELNERDRFAAQLQVQFQHIYQNRELLQITFQYLDKEKELTHFLTKAQMQDLHWVSKQLIRVYGERIEDYVIDCATLLIGITISYSLRIFMNDCQEIELKSFVQYVLRRMDGIVASFKKDEKPLFTKQMLDDFLQSKKQETIHYYRQIKAMITKLRHKLSQLHIDKRQTEKISDCLDTLENEFSSIEHEPKEYICEGLLLYLEKQKLPNFETDLQKLTKSIRAHA